MTRAELLVIADRAATYPAGQGYTYIAGRKIETAEWALRVLREKPSLLESG